MNNFVEFTENHSTASLFSSHKECTTEVRFSQLKITAPIKLNLSNYLFQLSNWKNKIL